MLEQARRQDELAWGKLVDLYTPLVWRWCRRANLAAADIENICQNVFRNVHRALPRFHREHAAGSFRAWLRTITQNKLRDHWRRRKPDHAAGGSDAAAQLQELAETDDGSASAVDDEQELGILYRRAVQVIRSEVEERSWQAFWRVTIDDEPVATVAAALGMSTNAVYLVRSRIRRRLRELLDDLGEAPQSNS